MKRKKSPYEIVLIDKNVQCTVQILLPAQEKVIADYITLTDQLHVTQERVWALVLLTDKLDSIVVPPLILRRSHKKMPES